MSSFLIHRGTLIGPENPLQFSKTLRVRPTDPHFATVVSIRHAAYCGRLADVPAFVAHDQHDETTDVTLGYVDDQAVGTLRICVRPEITAFDYDCYPAHRTAWPSLEHCVTMSRVAVLPSFQGRGLLRELLLVAEAAAHQAERRYIAAGADIRLIPAYERHGWTRTGVRYQSHLGPMSEFITFALDRPGRTT